MNINDNLFSLIRIKYNLLSQTQKVVADYILKHPEEIIMYTLHDVSKACNVSETTVIRFLRKIGYDSYQVFRVHIAKEVSRTGIFNQSDTDISEDIKDNDSIENIVEKVLQLAAVSIQDAKKTVDPSQVELASHLILNSNKIIWVGMGSSSAIILDGFHKLLKLGVDSSYYSDPHMINIICGQMKHNDLLIAVSHSGESKEVLTGVELAKSNGCKILAITSYPRSSLARKSDCIILSSSMETKYRSDAMTSRLIQLIIIDMLYISLSMLKADAKEFLDKSRESVAKNKT